MTNLTQTNEKSIVTGFAFVNHVDRNFTPTIENPKEFIKSKFYGSTMDNNILRYGIYRQLGYQYDLKPYLKKFLYKQYGSWSEAYAPNKTTLRKCIFGKIDQIVTL